MREKKYFVCSDIYNLKDLVYAKNIRFCYLNFDIESAPTVNLNFDTVITPDFDKHIKYYQVTLQNGVPILLSETEPVGRVIEACQSIYDLIAAMKLQSHNFYFVKNHDSMDGYFDSIEDAKKAVSEWMHHVAEYQAKSAIIESLDD